MTMTLLMLARTPNEDILADIARALGKPETRPTSLIVETWTTTKELEEKILSVGARHEVSQLDIVGHGDRGECFALPTDPFIFCYRNRCSMLDIGNALQPGATVRILACDFADAAVRDGGWSFDPRPALAWLQGQLRGKNESLRVSGVSVMIEGIHFDHTGFIGSSLPMLSSQ